MYMDITSEKRHLVCGGGGGGGGGDGGGAFQMLVEALMAVV